MFDDVHFDILLSAPSLMSAAKSVPRKDHAVVMVKFSHDCLNKMRQLARSLELELGPGTADLTMRFGLHSGPVTVSVSQVATIFFFF